MLEINAISAADARKWCIDRGDAITQTEFGNEFAICVSNEESIKGVIIMGADHVCSLIHLHTDATSLVGSILYGAAWRAAKALGYKTITL